MGDDNQKDLSVSSVHSNESDSTDFDPAESDVNEDYLEATEWSHCTGLGTTLRKYLTGC